MTRRACQSARLWRNARLVDAIRKASDTQEILVIHTPRFCGMLCNERATLSGRKEAGRLERRANVLNPVLRTMVYHRTRATFLASSYGVPPRCTWLRVHSREFVRCPTSKNCGRDERIHARHIQAPVFRDRESPPLTEFAARPHSSGTVLDHDHGSAHSHAEQAASARPTPSRAGETTG